MFIRCLTFFNEYAKLYLIELPYKNINKDLPIMDKKIIIGIIVVIAIAAGAYFYTQNDEPTLGDLQKATENAASDMQGKLGN